MALQTSGPISFLEIQTEYGGVNPISMDEYYKGGVYVPETVTEPAGAWVFAPESFENTFRFDSGQYRTYVKWNIDVVTPINIGVTGQVFSVTIAGYEYYRGNYRWNYTGGSKGSGSQSYYTIQRRPAAGLRFINGSVPSSSVGGALGLGNFYGGRKT